MERFVAQLSSSEFSWLFAICCLVGVAAFFGMFYFLRHGRIMRDTPTSKIRSAVQGFVELAGVAKSVGDPLYAPGTGTQCAWYSYKVEERNRDLSRDRDSWRTVRNDRSHFSFYVDDGTGVCAIDPDEATVKPKTVKRWTQGNRRYTEQRIDEGEDVYCLGQFETEMGPTRESVIKETARAILNELKQDRERLLAKLDVNGDGEIDMAEWERARKAARAQAQRQVSEDYEPTQHHVLIKPFNRSHPYLISGHPEHAMTRRYTIFSVVLLALFLAAGSYAVFMLSVRPGVIG